MSVFGAYSKYYDLLYKDKDYVGEAQYVHEKIQKFAPGVKRILDLGCGTGRHDFELAKLGYEVTGIDLSEEMLATASSCLLSLNSNESSDLYSSLNFCSGDIRTVRLNQTFDVVVSLFHVMSYQTSNEDLQAAFATVTAHLKPGGLFIFDCWYGPAVLTDLPEVRIKRFEDMECEVLRIAEPVMHYNDNVVDVNYQVMVKEKATDKVETLLETHHMRYLFMPELEKLIDNNKMEKIFTCEWMSERVPGNDTWGLFVGLSSGNKVVADIPVRL